MPNQMVVVYPVQPCSTHQGGRNSHYSSVNDAQLTVIITYRSSNSAKKKHTGFFSVQFLLAQPEGDTALVGRTQV